MPRVPRRVARRKIPEEQTGALRNNRVVSMPKKMCDYLGWEPGDTLVAVLEPKSESVRFKRVHKYGAESQGLSDD